MKYFISLIFLFLASNLAFAETYTFRDRVLLIEKDYLVIQNNRQKFMLVNKHSPSYTRIGSSFKTTYFDAYGHKMSFDELAGIGYIEQAKITVKDNLVKEIIVLEMHQ